MAIEIGQQLGHLKVLTNPFSHPEMGEILRCCCSACDSAVTVQADQLNSGDYTCPGCKVVWQDAIAVDEIQLPSSEPNQAWRIEGTDNSVYYSKREFAQALGISLYQAGKVVDGYTRNGIEYRLS